MDDNAAILDYAGPRKRSVFRLPARSDLAVSVVDGRATVHESLAGQAGATAGLVFGLFVLVVVTMAGTSEIYNFKFHRFYSDPGFGAFLLFLDACEAATMYAVLQQTWRQTVLEVEYDDVRLAFLSPFHRRRYRWTGNDIADVVVAPTANAETGLVLGELLITRLVGGEIRLFTDHAAARLGPIAVAVHNMLREGYAINDVPAQAAPKVAQVAEPVIPDIAPRAEVTTGRLVDIHRIFRERHGGPTDRDPSQ